MPEPASEDLLQAADEIEKALKDGKADSFHRALKKRGAALRALLQHSQDRAPSTEILLELAEQNREWIAAATRQLALIGRKLEDLKSRRTATVGLTGAYRASTTQGRCIDRTG